jgi:hypothetical protein
VKVTEYLNVVSTAVEAGKLTPGNVLTANHARGQCLRARRELLQPEDVGMPTSRGTA